MDTSNIICFCWASIKVNMDEISTLQVMDEEFKTFFIFANMQDVSKIKKYQDYSSGIVGLIDIVREVNTEDLFESIDLDNIQYGDLDAIEKRLLKHSVKCEEVCYQISVDLNNVMQRKVKGFPIEISKFLWMQPDDYLIKSGEIELINKHKEVIEKNKESVNDDHLVFCHKVFSDSIKEK